MVSRKPCERKVKMHSGGGRGELEPGPTGPQGSGAKYGAEPAQAGAESPQAAGLSFVCFQERQQSHKPSPARPSRLPKPSTRGREKWSGTGIWAFPGFLRGLLLILSHALHLPFCLVYIFPIQAKHGRQLRDPVLTHAGLLAHAANGSKTGTIGACHHSTRPGSNLAPLREPGSRSAITRRGGPTMP